MKRWLYIFILLICGTSTVFAQDHYVWQFGVPLNQARAGHATAVADGKIYVFGGQATANRRILNSVEVFDPEGGEWTRGRSLPVPLYLPSAVEFNDNIYLFGGLTPDRGPSNQVILYDTSADTFVVVGRLQGNPRFGMSAIRVGRRILLLGGLDEQQDRQDDNYWFDPDENDWNEDAVLNHAATGFAAAYGAGSVWVAGGFARGPLDRLERFNGRSWVEETDMPVASGGLSATFLGDTLVAAGGRGHRVHSMSSVYGYNTADAEWFEMPEMNVARTDFTLVNLNDELYAIGGVTGQGDRHRILDNVEVYRLVDLAVDDRTSRFASPSSLCSPRAFPNPSNGSLSFDLPGTAGVLKITTLNGRTINAYELNDSRLFTLPDMASLPAGNYLYIFKPNDLNQAYTGSFTLLK